MTKDNGMRSVRDMKTEFQVFICRELVSTILEGAKRLYPKESILLLRGTKSKNRIVITDLIVPPLASYGRGFAQIQLHRLPMDFSIVGTVHSHPSGNINPSSTDLNHFIGKLLMITAFPFENELNIAVYARSGERVMFQTTKN